jgi:hypothetical protein
MREQDTRGTSVGQIEKRRETMADGRRYMIYYTFRPLPDRASTSEAGKSSAESGPDGEEQGNV